ncbi:MAG: putative response regulator, CheY [Pedosphaera sp.]|nr:putative response regulator, CheY [Pedosphaera sp.]
MKPLPRRWRVLVADDFAEHCIMLACAIRQTDCLQVVHTVSTGQQAINYFIGKGPYAERETFPLPRVLITELDMPCADGRKLLVRLGNECFPRPIVVVLTASPLPEARQEARQLGADAFFVKPDRFRDLVVVVREIEQLAVRTFGSWSGSSRRPQVRGGESG